MLEARFNEQVPYKGERLTWCSVISEECDELGRYLVGKSRTIDFMEPSPTLERFDNRRLRSKISSLNASEARRVGIPKQSLQDLKVKVRSPQPFKLHDETMRRLLAV